MENTMSMQTYIQLMPTKELLETNQLSVGASTVCMIAKLNTVEEIVAYYRENGNFLDIRGCGATKNNELIVFCQLYGQYLEKYQPHNNEFELPHATSVLTLKNTNLISRRAYTICRTGNLYTIASLLERFESRGSFINIDGCGKATDEELINFCLSVCETMLYSSLSSGEERIGLKATSAQIEADVVESLSPIKRAVLAIKFTELWSTMTVRIQNAYYNLTNDNSLNFYIENHPFIVENLSKQSRIDSTQSLFVLHDKVKEYAQYLQGLDDIYATQVYNKLIITNCLGGCLQADTIPFDITGNVRLFSYVDILISKKYLEDAKLISRCELYLLKNYCLYYSDSKRNTLEVAAKACGLVRVHFKTTPKKLT